MPEPAISKSLGIVIAILTIVSIICGAVFWIVHQNDMLQMQVSLLNQQAQSNTETLRQLNSKNDQGDANFTRILEIMGRLHNAK